MRDDPAIALSVVRALRGMVTANLRQVAFRRGGATVYLRFVYDGPVSEENREDAGIAASEVLSDLGPDGNVLEDCLRADMPATPPSSEGWWVVFERKEERR